LGAGSRFPLRESPPASHRGHRSPASGATGVPAPASRPPVRRSTGGLTSRRSPAVLSAAADGLLLFGCLAAVDGYPADDNRVQGAVAAAVVVLDDGRLHEDL